jgi:hypothetical protein
MSQQENGAAPPRPSSNSYPEPHTYPSPQMQPSYAYPPPQGQSTNEPYRQSPTSSTMPPTNLNLPPIRGIDGQSQMPPGQQASPPPLPPGQPMPAYPYVPPPGQPMIPGQVGPYPPQRYPLPAQNADARMMSGGRHKKEIKRRTKTGCLTCRKRRIKVSLCYFVSTLAFSFQALVVSCLPCHRFASLVKKLLTQAKRTKNFQPHRPHRHQTNFHKIPTRFHFVEFIVDIYSFSCSVTSSIQSVAIASRASASVWDTIPSSSNNTILLNYNRLQVRRPHLPHQYLP